MRVLLVSANREQLPSPVVPIGPLAVAASLRDAHDVHLLDLCFEEDPRAAVERAIIAIDPEVIGVGLRNLHTNAYDGMDRLLVEYGELAAWIRASSKAPIVLGGPAYSLQPETLLVRLGADFGVVGEGERAFRDLVDRLARGERPARIHRAPVAPPGMVRARRLYGGASWPASDLDDLPLPARDLVDPRYYAFDGTDNLQTKRGCAFACAYCDYPDLEGTKVRVRDPVAIADEMVARADVPGVTHMFFVDSVFNVPRSHAIAVCREIERRGNPMPWVCYASPVALDEEVVGAMARAGCAGVEIGSDSGTPRMLAQLKKPFSIEQIASSRALFREYGIHDCHTFVLGAFDETAEEVEETLAFVERLNPDVAVFIVFMEDRETMTVGRARHRDAILRLLAEQAPKRQGWVVPELGIRFGAKINAIVRRRGLKGPSWLHLARMRRGGSPASASGGPSAGRAAGT
ncbi:MAG TPA: radical SAM protein [Polyangiaceae bacterium]|nr:radical SAM protein [Polyangiaceae bacterium]